jgi:hypothetical protein
MYDCRNVLRFDDRLVMLHLRTPAKRAPAFAPGQASHHERETARADARVSERWSVAASVQRIEQDYLSRDRPRRKNAGKGIHPLRVWRQANPNKKMTPANSKGKIWITGSPLRRPDM